MKMQGIEHKPWSEYPLRTCQSLHHCNLCSKDITYGQEYRDGGYGRRAHAFCVALDDEKKADQDT